MALDVTAALAALRTNSLGPEQAVVAPVAAC